MSHVEVIASWYYYIHFPKRHYNNIFSEKLVNKLHYWIEKHPHLILPPNVSDSLFVKINGTLVKNHNYIPQISVLELHNDMILPIFQGYFLLQYLLMEKYLLETRLLGSTRQNIKKPMSKNNNITCGCKTCISAMLLQSNLSKWRLS